MYSEANGNRIVACFSNYMFYIYHMNKIASLFLIVFLWSCNNDEKKHQVSFTPAITPTKGYEIPRDSIEAPKIIRAGKPIVVKSGIPVVNQTNLNIHIAGEAKIIIPSSPKISTPGTDTFSFPKIVKAIIKPKYAGVPSIVVAKDAAAKDINPANFSFYKTLQGLLHNSVRCILQDKSGNLWLGTYGGVCRYDGKTFTNFTEKEGLSSNFVNAILEDKSGNLWFGTNGGGISKYDGKFFTNFSEDEGLSSNIVYSISQDHKGDLWFGTSGGGACRYDGKSFTHFTEKQGLSSNIVWSIKEDKNKTIWFSTENGVVCYDGKSFTNYSKKHGVPHKVVSGIIEDKKGNLWFATDSGVCCYDRKVFTIYTEQQGLLNNAVYTISEDKSGNLWFGTGGGLCCYDGKSFTSFTYKEGMSTNFVNAVFEDKSGNIWIGTDGGGLCRYNGKVFTNFTDKEGLSDNTVWNILEDTKNNIWFATNNGVCCYDEKNFSNYTEKEGLLNNFVYSMFEDGAGNIWFGTNNGVCRYDNKSFTYYRDDQGLVSNVVYAIIEDKKKNLWFATSQGVSSFDGNTFTNFSKKQGLPDNIVLSMLLDKSGRIWFGTNGGACSYDGQSFVNYTDKQGLAGNIVYSIYEDNIGNIWFGTGGGVSFYDGNTFINFTEKEGLSNNAVLNILQDKDGNMWFGTRNGLSRVEPKQLKNLFEKKGNFNPIQTAFFYNYTYNDGFLGLNCRRNSVLQDRKGRIWWGAAMLTRYDTKGNSIDTAAPVVNLTSVKLFGEEIEWANLGAVDSDTTGNEIVSGRTNDTLLSNGILLKDIKFNGLSKWYNLPEHLSLPYNNNNLTFNFIGVHLQSLNHIKYQYKLEGMDPDWSSINERTEATYGNLPSGDYIFKVKAMNQSGIWSKTFEYGFEVRPPWWQTWWFRALVIILIFTGIVIYIKWREKSLKQRQKELVIKVNEATQEIKDQKHLIEEKHKEITDSINYAERIQHSFLATKEVLDENLKDYFILFKPKAIVSGDFYWASKLHNGNFVYVTADSTGHGVPGAIMSIANIACLKESITEGKTEANEILNETRKLIIEYLKNDGSTEGGKDGMDASLVVLNKEKTKLTYAAANNPVWVVRDQKIIELAADKMPVGKHDRDSIPFTNHNFELLKGDVIYTLTDGMPDQFGGAKGKKFMYKRLKDLLVSISGETMQNQYEKLINVLSEWKGDIEQIDDITIIGVRV